MKSLQEQKLGYRFEEAAALIGSKTLLQEMIHAKWIKPVIHRHKLTLFDRGDLLRAWARILNGEVP